MATQPSPPRSASGAQVPARVAVILNPASGRGAGRRKLHTIRKLMDTAAARFGTHVEYFPTEAPGHARTLCEDAVRHGYDAVAVAGGDGTLHEVVDSLRGAEMPIAVLPTGTGNDFARTHLGGLSLEAAVDCIFSGVPCAVDAGIANGRWFINAVGTGFDAAVAGRINSGYRWLTGTSAYVAAVVETLFRFEPVEMRVELDNSVLEGPMMLCTVANSRSYGGGMKIAPTALLDDGLLDVCILEAAGRIEFMSAFPRVFRGAHVAHPKFHLYQAKRVTITAAPQPPLLLDGEVLHGDVLEVKVLPGALRLFSPKRGKQ